MPTLNQLVEAVRAEVYSDTQTIDSSSYLTSGINATDTQISVADASRFSAGIIEIGSELILVDQVNRDTGVLTLHAAGRGIRGTTAASHAAGDPVTMSPAISRQRIEQAVEETLRATSLYGVASTDLTYSAGQVSYTLPAGTKSIIAVSWDPGYTLTPEWTPVRRWSHDRNNGALVLGDFITPGRTVRVAYRTDPVVPAFTADFSDTGLPDSCIDVIRFGAAWRVVSFLEPMSLLANAAEAKANDRNTSSTQRSRVAQYYYQMFSQRQSEELARLNEDNPIRVHFGGTV